MPIWPFKRRRRANTIPTSETNLAKDTAVSEKVKPAHSKSAPASPPAEASPPPLPISSNELTRQLLEGRVDNPAQWSERGDRSANKENISPRHYQSREDITALPSANRLDQSPHLRPVDLEQRPPIPYNFRPQSMSQTSIQRTESYTKPPRPHTLHSKRSTTDYSTPRRTSSKQSKKRDEALREEEIRAMSAPIPIPKRPGEGPLRRESKKVRGLGGGRGSEVSLPAEGSIHSAMSGVNEQRGWEIGGIAAVFSPRPAIRLSGTPQGVVSSSVPNQSSGILYRIESIRGKQKATPVAKDPPRTPRRRRIIGDEADELDASDIRLLMERDAKRKEKKQRDRQEQLDRKLRAREGRNRGDSDLRRRDTEEQKRIDDGRARAEEQILAQGPLTPPTAVHPALRNIEAEEGEAGPVGLGTEKQREVKPEPMDVDRQEFSTPDPIIEERESEHGDAPRDPFSDDAQLPPPRSLSERPENLSGTSLPMESPMDEPIIATAQAIRMSQTNTPPLSPVYGARAASSASQLPEAIRQQSMSAQSAQSISSLPRPPPIPSGRRVSDPPKERRAGAWASFFRRGTTLRRGQNATEEPTSFSNTSRESMRNQPLPAHLVDPQIRRPSNVRTKSGTPVRTQSKFREDLPEMPMSPPDSPDVTTMAAAVAAARRAGKIKPEPIEIPGSKRSSSIVETPGSERVRGHTAMAGSLASIDSEGSWLAGPGNRQSIQSALSRSYSKRNVTGSYEELGEDKDAEIVNRNIAYRTHKVSSPTLGGAAPEEESDEDITLVPEDDPLTRHGSVRRKPTLVQRDPRLKSREGLVSEYAAIEPAESEVYETPGETPNRDGSDDEMDFPHTSPEPELQRATSVQYVGRHSRQFSAGSARLLDVRRGSKTETPEPPATALSDATEHQTD